MKDPVTPGAKVSIESEKSSKIYSDGAYLPGTEDLGYQSASQSPNDSLRRAEDGVITEAEEPDTEAVVLKPNNLLKIENAIDPLSVSLPETFLKSVKTDLSQSIKSTASTKSRVHYDPRIFSSQGRARKQDPEKEYFEQMSRFYGEMNERFPSQAHNSRGAADSGHKVRFSGRPHILYLFSLSLFYFQFSHIFGLILPFLVKFTTIFQHTEKSSYSEIPDKISLCVRNTILQMMTRKFIHLMLYNDNVCTRLTLRAVTSPPTRWSVST